MDSRTSQQPRQAADTARFNAPARRSAPVRLPQPTADLVNRILAARCGSGR